MLAWATLTVPIGLVNKALWFCLLCCDPVWSPALRMLAKEVEPGDRLLVCCGLGFEARRGRDADVDRGGKELLESMVGGVVWLLGMDLGSRRLGSAFCG